MDTHMGHMVSALQPFLFAIAMAVAGYVAQRMIAAHEKRRRYERVDAEPRFYEGAKVHQLWSPGGHLVFSDGHIFSLRHGRIEIRSDIKKGGGEPRYIWTGTLADFEAMDAVMVNDGR